MTADAVATKAKLEAQNFTGLTKDDILGDLLYTTALSYHAELEVMNQITAKTMGLVAITYPSETIFSFELKSNYYFGIPISVSPSGLAMDADRLITLVKSLDGDKEKPKQFMITAGMNGSALEHSLPEQLFSTPDNPAQGISAVKALKIASDQGIPVYTINQSNINAVLPQLQLDTGTITDIQNAVNAGKDVTVSKTEITLNGWAGCGYVIIDPNSGAGAYMISGGLSGGLLYKNLKWFMGVVRNPATVAVVQYFAGLLGDVGLVISVFLLFFSVADIFFNSNNTWADRGCAIIVTTVSQVIPLILGRLTGQFAATALVLPLMYFGVDLLSSEVLNRKCGLTF